jgi:hypothetical protein
MSERQIPVTDAELHTLLEATLVEMTDEVEGKVIRIEESGLLAYQKDGQLYLEWSDGFTIHKPLASIRALLNRTEGDRG